MCHKAKPPSGPTRKEIEELLADFYTPAEAWQWTCTPQKLLNGEVPLDLILTGRADEVLVVIATLQDGVYV